MSGCGFVPVEYKVIIRPEEIDDTDPVLKRAKAAGIEIAHDTKDRERMAQIRGTLVAAGGNAFEDWKPPIPKVGDKVYFAKYSGINLRGDDGQEYRLANDKDLSAIIG